MFNIKLDSVEHVNIVLAGLAKLPYEIAAPMIELVRTQAQEQSKPAQQESAGLTD